MPFPESVMFRSRLLVTMGELGLAIWQHWAAVRVNSCAVLWEEKS